MKFVDIITLGMFIATYVAIKRKKEVTKELQQENMNINVGKYIINLFYLFDYSANQRLKLRRQNRSTQINKAHIKQ